MTSSRLPRSDRRRTVTIVGGPRNGQRFDVSPRCRRIVNYELIGGRLVEVEHLLVFRPDGNWEARRQAPRLP